MRIQTTHLWSKAQAIKVIVQNSLTLDPTILGHNSLLFFVEERGKLVSFCALLDHGSCTELKAVYTIPQYRRKGYASRMIQHALRDAPTVYLECRQQLIPFYTSLGFYQIHKAPWPLAWRRNVYNICIRPFTGATIHVMKT